MTPLKSLAIAEMAAQCWPDGVPHVNAIFLSSSENVTIRHILPKTRFLGYIFVADAGGNFNHCDAVQLQSRSLFSVPIESPYATSYAWIVTYIPCTVSEIWRIIGPVFVVDRWRLSLTHSFGVESINLWLRNLAQETRNIALSCRWKMFRYLEPFRRGPRVTDRRTDKRTLWYQVLCLTIIIIVYYAVAAHQ